MKKALMASLLSMALLFAPTTIFAEIKKPHSEMSGTNEIEETPDMADSIARKKAREAWLDDLKNQNESILESMERMGISRDEINRVISSNTDPFLLQWDREVDDY